MGNDENNSNEDSSGRETAKEGSRSDLIRSRLVFQQVLSLPSEDKNKQSKTPRRHTKKRRHKKHRKRSDPASSSPVDGTRSDPKGDSGPVDPSLPSTDGNDDDDDDESRIDHRGSREDPVATSGIRTLLTSIRLLVFFDGQDVPVGAKKMEKKVSKAVLKDQTTCSICLSDYAVGDVVVRLKSNVAGDNDTSTCNHCFHEDCILEWLENHDECPLCRIDMVHSRV